MLSKPSKPGFMPSEHRISVRPSVIASMVVLAIIIFYGSVIWPQSPTGAIAVTALGTFGIVYLFVFNFLLVPSPHFRDIYNWLNAILTAVGLAALTFLTSSQLALYIAVLLILAAITSSITAEWGPAYLLVILSTTLIMFFERERTVPMRSGIFHVSAAIIALIAVETIRQLKNLSRDRIRKLETITEFSRQIVSSLETQQVLKLLNTALRNAVEADTYFVGMREGDEMRLELIYDDKQYYENQRVKLEGTLSGWVFENQQSLFLPDLRKDVSLPRVRLVLLGKHKTSLSWMGVPMRGNSVDGILVIGSYRPNAFDRADLELLSNLAQHAALALDNAYRHSQVELQAHLDSLTGVYNHGYFLKLLKEQADQALRDEQPLSLIMLDVDYFKQYNDTYGHLAGDEILTSLCAAIKQHIKTSDAVGRWGGEEFVISLPNANANQAIQIALRIRSTLSTLTVQNHGKDPISVPTISQGIALFPDEVNEVIKLVDLADRRLYIAKARGRNQIEPSPDQMWLDEIE